MRGLVVSQFVSYIMSYGRHIVCVRVCACVWQRWSCGKSCVYFNYLFFSTIWGEQSIFINKSDSECIWECKETEQNKYSFLWFQALAWNHAILCLISLFYKNDQVHFVWYFCSISISLFITEIQIEQHGSNMLHWS